MTTPDSPVGPDVPASPDFPAGPDFPASPDFPAAAHNAGSATPATPAARAYEKCTEISATHPHLTADGVAAVATAAAEHWRAVALCTDAADRETAEQAVRALYARWLPGSDPEIIWCRSPLEAARLVVAADGRHGRPVRDRVRDQVWAAGRAELADRFGPREFGRVWQTACGTLAPLLSTLITRVSSAVEARAADDAERVALRIALTHAVHGQFDAAWLPLYEAAGMACDLGRIARAAGWWWPFENAVILTERPLALRLDDQGRLHHGAGPALAYPDGFALHFWRGTRLDPEFAARLAVTTPELIRAEENAEQRRMMVEYYTPERFLKESGAQPVQQDETGKLWRIEMPGDESIVMVEVVNSSPEPDGTFNVYFLRVPPRTRTAKEGVAWTFGLTEDEYRPMKQT